MKIRVNPHNVEIVREETEPINELEVKVSKCEFEFDEKITNEFVKEAYFTLNGSTYKQIIVNNECDYPNEVLTEKGTLEIGVVAYKVENGEELIRYNPSPDYYDTWVGSLKDAENTEPLTPTDKEQMQSQISQNTSDISDLQANKQDKLTQGANITIDENNVISAVDTIYDDTEIKADIQELQETKVDKDVNNLTYYTLTTETGSKITLSIDSSTYVMTLKLKDKNNNDISTDSIDLPLETMVVGARYDSTTKEIVLTLKNEQEVRFSVADLVSGLQTEITENNKLSSDLVDDTNNTNKFVSASEKAQITTNKNDITAIKDGQSIDSFSDVETALNLKEDKSNKVTEINSSSTDTQYPSAKCVYDSQEEQNEQLAELEMLYNAFPTVSDENETIQLDNTAKVKFREIDLKGNTSQVVIPEEQGTSVSNTSISISDVDTDKENTIEMSGNTYQETTTGKNLANFIDSQVYNYTNGVPSTISQSSVISNKTNNSYNIKYGTNSFLGVVSNTMEFEENTDYIFSFNRPYNSNFTQRIHILQVNNDDSYTLLQAINVGVYGTPYTYTYSNTTAKKVAFMISTNNSNPKDETETISEIMVRKSTTSDTYEPFTNGASPNPDYPQNIEVVTGENDIKIEGKNLFDAQTHLKASDRGIYATYNSNNSITFSGTPTTTYSNIFTSVGNVIQKDKTYTFSVTGTKNFSIGFRVTYTDTTYDEFNVVSSATKSTFTPSKDVSSFRVYIYNLTSGTSYDTTLYFQLEENSTATTYEPYVSQSYPVNLGNIELCRLNVDNTIYKDRIYQLNNKWYLEKNISKVILNGSEGYWFRTSINTNTLRFNNETAIPNGYVISAIKIMSNKFINGSGPSDNGDYEHIRNGGSDYTNSLSIIIDKTRLPGNTANDFTNWLSNNNVTVYYLANATTTEITDTNLVNQLNALYNATIYPITNINTDTSNLLPYIDLHYNFVTPSPSPSRPSVVNVVKGNNTITISNSDNTETQNYPINLGDMELCKIGTYQDYIYESNGNWYKHSEIGKVVLNGSETWSKSANRFVCGKVASIIKPTSSNDEVAKIFSDKFVGVTINNTTQSQPLNGIAIAGSGNLVIYYDAVINFTYGEFRNWLSTNNVLVYYILETPTDTQITDTTLITQLNNIKKAYSYDTQTNISQTNTDKPFIIYAEAIRSLKDVFE